MRFPVQQGIYARSIMLQIEVATKQFHALLRAMHAFEISIHSTSRRRKFQDVFQKN